jgi:hypothetical protein
MRSAKGFEEERKRGQIGLFPVRLDETVMKMDEAWAAKLRARLSGDFRSWKDHDAARNSRIFARSSRRLSMRSLRQTVDKSDVNDVIIDRIERLDEKLTPTFLRVFPRHQNILSEIDHVLRSRRPNGGE